MQQKAMENLDLVAVQAAFDVILAELGPDKLDDVIETTLARCAVKRSRRPHARRLLETAFALLLERKTQGMA